MMNICWIKMEVTGIFPLGKFTPEGSPRNIPHHEYSWLGQVSGLGQWGGEHTWEEYTGVERSGRNFPGGSIPRTGSVPSVLKRHLRIACKTERIKVLVCEKSCFCLRAEIYTLAVDFIFIVLQRKKNRKIKYFVREPLKKQNMFEIENNVCFQE